MEQRKRVYTVTEINRAVRDCLRMNLPEYFWVRGEILEFADRERYLTFSLCEKSEDVGKIKAKVKVMVWGDDVYKIEQKLQTSDAKLDLQNGLKVELKCEPDLWVQEGRFQIIARDIEPAYTFGELHQARERIFQELKKLGLHDKNKQLPFPICPLRVALITSRDSAGFVDFVSELRLSRYSFKVELFHCAVQGEAVAGEVCYAIEKINLLSERYDVIAIVRGGGSAADLRWFDNKDIGIAIANAKLPVLTGIGHEINLTVADMVAYKDFKTPTAVADFLVDSIKEFENKINYFLEDICSLSKNTINTKSSELSSLVEQLKIVSKNLVNTHRLNLIHRMDFLKTTVLKFLETEKNKLKSIVEIIRVSDPKNILKLGFSITRNSKGKVVKNIKTIPINEQITTQLLKGWLESRVVNKGGGK